MLKVASIDGVTATKSQASGQKKNVKVIKGKKVAFVLPSSTNSA